MRVRTQNSVYEIELGRRRFRRLEGAANTKAPPLREWQDFGQISPVAVGEPLRIYWLKGRAGAMARIGIWTTARVVEILDEGSGDEHIDATTRPIVEADPPAPGDPDGGSRTSH